MAAQTNWPNNAGLVYHHRARATGTVVSIYRNSEAGLDDDGGEMPWSTVCEDHSGVTTHRTRALAHQWAPYPDEWCPDCQDAAARH